MIYNEIVSTYAGAEWVDHWHLPNGYIMYYNGITTIKDKTQLAMKQAAGIMIWELTYDLPGRKSLLNAHISGCFSKEIDLIRKKLRKHNNLVGLVKIVSSQRFVIFKLI